MKKEKKQFGALFNEKLKINNEKLLNEKIFNSSFFIFNSQKQTAYTLGEGATHVVTCNNTRKVAFTLAEVLITLGVIGVVAALTIPTLIQKIEEQRTIAQLLKVHSTLSQAWQRMETEYGTIDSWGMSTTDTDTDKSNARLVRERLSKYLKVANLVDNITFKKEVYNIRNEKQANSTTLKTGMYLNDGTLIGVGSYNSNNSIHFAVFLPYKRYYTNGKDIFYFTGFPYKFLPQGIGNQFETMCKPTATSSNTGRACTAWVIYNKNMDYLHCPDELSWDGKHKCN